jgi:hypothetical protein
MSLSQKVLSLLTGVSVAAMVASTAQAAPMLLQTHGYMQNGKLVVTSAHVLQPKAGTSRKSTVYYTYNYTYTEAVMAPLAVSTNVAQVGEFTQTASGACVGLPAGKYTEDAGNADVNGKWSEVNQKPATVAYTGTLANGTTCTGGQITGFINSELNYKWSNKTAVAGTTVDNGTAVWTFKDAKLTAPNHAPDKIEVVITYTDAVTYCGKPAKGTTTCPAAASTK